MPGWTHTVTAGGTFIVSAMQEFRDAIAIHDGIGTMTSSGVTVTFTSAFAAVDDYKVVKGWEENTGLTADQERFVVTKAVGSVVIAASGGALANGKKFSYTIQPVKGL